MAQAGTAETKSEQGLPPQVGGSVITGGSVMVVEAGWSVQEEVGLAVTHAQRFPTASMTAGESRPQAFTTQRIAVS